MDSQTTKRLFFGLEVSANWLEKEPTARPIQKGERHITLAFLGNIDFETFKPLLESIPLPKFHVGSSGLFERFLFLPPKNPKVVAYLAEILSQKEEIHAYHLELTDFLRDQGYKIDKRPFLAHTTVARSPFTNSEWKQAFSKKAFIVNNIHLYQSLGNLTYSPIWTHPLIAPFEEIPHTADMAFLVRGEKIEDIYYNALAALFFNDESLIPFLEKKEPKTLDEIIIALNELITKADGEIGASIKAVSFHGKIQKISHFLEWEMIIDV